MKLRLTLLFIICLPAFLQAQTTRKPLVEAYIAQYRELAIAEMKRTGVPAAITLAQGIHESGAGQSDLASRSNNHFGIKCKSNWTGESVRHDDDARGECFRKYPSVEDSYRDHSDFLKNGARYASLFSLDPTDYAGWAHGLKKAGYATNPKYPQVLIGLVELYDLQQYTLLALGQPAPARETEPVKETSAVTSLAIAEVPAPSYPTGVFHINNTPVIYARKGQSWLALATAHRVDLARLFEFNEQPVTEFLEQDQLVYLQRKRKTGSRITHIITPGETLHGIAQQYGIRLESLRELNGLRERDLPAAGETLYLQQKAPRAPRLALQTDYTGLPGFSTLH